MPSNDKKELEGFSGIPKAGLSFLRGLEQNNNREWFLAHKSEFEESLLLPVRSLVSRLDEILTPLAPYLRIDPWKSIHRIHRDVRFSQDKSPYKTHVAAGFYTVPGEAGGAGLYFYISSKEIAAGGGIYMPSSAQLKSIRQQLAREPQQFQQIIKDKQVGRKFGEIRGERLQRPPQGFSTDDPMLHYLKLKQLYFIRNYDVEDSSKRQFADSVAGDLIPLLPFVEWLNRALKSI